MDTVPSPNPSPAWTSNDGGSVLYRGDALEWLQSLKADSVDCIRTDPPYNVSNDGTGSIE